MNTYTLSELVEEYSIWILYAFNTHRLSKLVETVVLKCGPVHTFVNSLFFDMLGCLLKSPPLHVLLLHKLIVPLELELWLSFLAFLDDVSLDPNA